MVPDTGATRFTSDQQAVETLINAACAEAESPFCTRTLRAVIKSAGNEEELRERFGALYNEPDRRDLQTLLDRSLFTADVLGYWAAERRVGVDLPSRPGGHGSGATVLGHPTAAEQSWPQGPLDKVEALNWIRAQGVRVPVRYYAERQALAHAMAFSLFGLARMDQLQDILDSLEDFPETPAGFDAWKPRIFNAGGGGSLPLSPERMERLFRDSLQGHFASGRCEQHQGQLARRPYLLYDAANEQAARVSHQAMHGLVARHNDPVWSRWRPPCGQRCRCRVVSLSPAEAKRLLAEDRRRLQGNGFAARARALALHYGPDEGWDLDLCAEPTAAIRRDIDRRREECKRYEDEEAEPGTDSMNTDPIDG